MIANLLSFEKTFLEWVETRGMSWERVRFPITAAGDATTGHRFVPAGPAERIVVTFHGAGNDALFAWVGLFKGLLEGGAEIFTFDLPGHGRSNATRFLAREASWAVRAALDECVVGRRSLPVHALGVSLGGAVLLRALPEVQGRLASAILVVAPLRITLSARSLVREIGPRTFRILWQEREHYGMTGLLPSFGPFRRGVYPLRLAEPPPPGPFGYVAALNAALMEMELEWRAPAVTIPVLLVYGDRDRIVPIEQGERLAALIERSRLVRVRGGTHLSTPLERETVYRVVEWMEEGE